jgi:hypothetical protein
MRASPTDHLEALESFLVIKPRNLREAQAPCGSRFEEVFRHVEAIPFG